LQGYSWDNAMIVARIVVIEIMNVAIAKNNVK